MRALTFILIASFWPLLIGKHVMSSDTKTEVGCSDLASKNLPEMKNVSSEALKKTFVAVEASIESSKF